LIRLIAALLALALLASCSSLQQTVAPEDLANAERMRQLAGLDAWTMQGRIAIKQVTGGSGQGKIIWLQNGEDTDISLSGPLGSGAVNIHWVPDEVVVSGADLDVQHRYTGSDAAEQFLAEQLGWQFPAASIRYWLLGLPNPDFAYTQNFSADGALLGLQQLGWTVDYQRFAAVNGYVLPAKLQVQGDAVRLRVVIDDWLLAK
jgi:outer membrane lipoprotein LolB